jgi:hypothetical protein
MRMTVTTQDRWPGIAVLAALALHAWSLGRADLPHMLWSCHVASFILAIGVLTRSRIAVTTGFLFHLGIGLPAWLVEVILTRGTFGGVELVWRVLATSILVHLAPIAAGLLYLGWSEIPRSSVLPAWLIQVGLVPISRWLTPPVFNVNVAHAVWPPLASIFQSWWMFQAIGSLVCLASLAIALMIWNFAVARVLRKNRHS